MKIEIIRYIIISKLRIFKAYLIRITLDIIIKKYPHIDKKQKPQCHKNQEKSRKMLEFLTKNRYKPLPLLEFTRVTNVSQIRHKCVTNTSQTCHKYVTNTSQTCHKYVTKKQVFSKICDFHACSNSMKCRCHLKSFIHRCWSFKHRIFLN